MNITTAMFLHKFGAKFPTLNDLCKICGENYGMHLGYECPTFEDEIQDLEPITFEPYTTESSEDKA
ncbi:hypothetical protein LCGC14_3161020, partial [marine sediment metagenome]